MVRLRTGDNIKYTYYNYEYEGIVSNVLDDCVSIYDFKGICLSIERKAPTTNASPPHILRLDMQETEGDYNIQKI